MAPTRVVFVDDEDRVLAALERSLRPERGSWEMVFTTDPQVAIEKLGETDYGILVTDWVMPFMDGLALCARVREHSSDAARGHIYTILLTGKSSPEDTVVALESGVDDFVRKPVDARELAARIKVGLRFLESERALRVANDRLTVLATTDPLTGVWNRRYGQQVLGAEMARVNRDKQSLSLLMMDLDHFKQVNDRSGHSAGDATLVEVAARVRRMIRQYDSLVRWGGEEFLVICPHTSHSDAMVVGERLRSCIAEIPVEIDASGGSISITVSMGVACTDHAAVASSEELVSRADQALYEAKRAGRNRVQAWSRTDAD
jgi:diguanylate cyclase (GGDEF)-like protein